MADRFEASLLFCSLLLISFPCSAFGLDPGKMYHFRNGEKREWDRYSNQRGASQFYDSFTWKETDKLATLKLSQVDVKQRWQVKVNETPIGNLVQDENPLTTYFKVDPALLRVGLNRVEVVNIERNPRGSDDIVIGRMEVIPRSIDEILNETQLTVNVTEDNKSTPARITILNEHGELQTVGAVSNETLAIRAGTVYTSNGTATFGLPIGSFRLYAGRGFEFSLASQKIVITNGKQSIDFAIERQVETSGYVACDTHVHTRTHSGHGDSTVQERMITLAGEGVELSITTDHNVQIDHRPYAKEMNVSKYFTTVTGNEVTTPVGHFNIFPVSVDQEVPNYQLSEWTEIFAEIDRTTQAPIVILNHARDIHSGVTPFAPQNFLSLVGESLQGWSIGFNAMEVINSGATQTDPLQLTHDWMNLLNAGSQITPVGSSDSHDVARHFVGQGRTYIRCDDSNPAKIDIKEVVAAFKSGDVAVSYGLMTILQVREYTSNPKQVELKIEVRSPDWIECDLVQLFENGRQVASFTREDLQMNKEKGHRYQAKFLTVKPSHDAVFVAVATGPGIEQPFWKTAFPYQPDSDLLDLKVIGLSKASWYDGDHDGKLTPAKGYAVQVFKRSNGDLAEIVKELTNYDETVAIHAAHLYQKNGGSFESNEYQETLKNCQPGVRNAFNRYLKSWQASQIARLQSNSKN